MAEAMRTANRRPTTARRYRRLGPRSLIGLAALFLFVAWRLLTAPRSAGRARPLAAGPGADQQHNNPRTAFEPTDWPLGLVALIFLATLVLLVICPLVLIAGYSSALPDVGRSLRIAPPGPRLQTNPAGDLLRFRAEEARRLDTYYWIDKQNGTVHIPIAQAMKNLVAAGLPGFPKGQP